jgi:hypothetical protein
VSREKEDIKSELDGVQNSNEEDSQRRTRQDLTEEYAASIRRLDTLSRLLAGHSQCVAVALYSDTLYITANEFSKNSRENNSNKALITNVIEYYTKLVNGETISPNHHNKIFKSICPKQRFGKEIQTLIRCLAQNESFLMIH